MLSFSSRWRPGAAPRPTAIGVVVWMAAALVFNLALSLWIEPTDLGRAILSAVVLPVMLGAPLIGYIRLRLREMAQRNAELRHAASHDGLTRLLNRGAFTHQVRAELDRIAESEGGRGALLIIDADHFKQVNDRYGHAMGDRALCRIAEHLRSVTRAGDVIGRLGGEEFGLFLPGAGMLSAEATAERLRHVTETMPLIGRDGEPVALSISVGGLFFRNAISFETLFRRTDAKLYDAKANGRNRVEFSEFRTPLPLTSAAQGR